MPVRLRVSYFISKRHPLVCALVLSYHQVGTRVLNRVQISASHGSITGSATVCFFLSVSFDDGTWDDVALFSTYCHTHSRVNCVNHSAGSCRLHMQAERAPSGVHHNVREISLSTPTDSEHRPGFSLLRAVQANCSFLLCFPTK